MKQKKPAKDQREKLVLLGLVELYLQTGKPVGSNTLRENGFESLSSATIRNYYTKLEEGGYLKQQHSSGGRIPTSLAYKLYATTHQENRSHHALTEKEKQHLRSKLVRETREIAKYLQEAAETLSDMAQAAIFLSAPRFDHDFVLDIKLLALDQKRCLCALITDFGLIHTEILFTENKLEQVNLKRIEAYLQWRITGLDKPELSEEEELLGASFYNEIMLRHIVRYTNFSSEDMYKTGFSKLLRYPDFNEASALASGLSLFENSHCLHTLLGDCAKAGKISCWIGEDLHALSPAATACSVLAIPYRINQTTVGSIALLGPSRLPYRKLFALLEFVSECMSDTLTKSMYKFKITFRQPQAPSLSRHNPIGLLAHD